MKPAPNIRFVLLRDMGSFPERLSHGMTGDVVESFDTTNGSVCHFVKFDGDHLEYWFYDDEISLSTTDYPRKLKDNERWMEYNNINFQ